MDGLKRDLRVALRLLLRDRAFSATVILTLALCIGANTALFAVVYNVLLRPLPVPEPDRVVLMSNCYPKAGAEDTSNAGVPDYYDRLEAVTALQEQALFNHSNVALGLEGRSTRILVANVTPSFFQVMPVRPILGRTFTAPEGEIGNEKKVLLSEAMWRSAFGGDPAAVGSDLRLDGEPYTVVGVMSRSIEPLDPGVQAWRPLAFTPEDRADDRRHSNSWWNLGRLRPGSTLDQVQAQVDALNAANMERFPHFREILENAGFHTRVAGYQDHLVRHVRPTLYLLWGGALFVLFIGGLNVANLVLVRTRARLKELVTRLALGAGRRQLAGQLVVEATVLTTLAAVVGLGLAAVALRTLGALELGDLPYGSRIGIDGAVVLFVALLSTALGVAMGLVPLARIFSANLTLVLREEGRATTGGRGARALRRSLVVAQVAFTLVLLAGAGLLLTSFRQVLEVDPGFVPEQVLTASVSLPDARYPDDDAAWAFTDEALRRVRGLPGVVAAGATDTIPFGGRHSDSVILAEGYSMEPGESLISPYRVNVTPGYFEAMGARLVRGRFFEEGDQAGSLPVIIVDEKLAQRFWPGEDPVGRRMYRPGSVEDLLAVDENTVYYTVVGVVGDIRLEDLAAGQPVGTYFFPMAQNAPRLVTFALKTGPRPDALAASLRAAVGSLDPELPVFDARTMDVRTEAALVNRRSPALLSLSFGVVALLLSAVGLYGVLAYLVAQRSREIAIRVAIGSSPHAVFGLVFREGAALVGAGLGAGAVGVLALRRTMDGLLFGVRPLDPLVLGAAVALLVGVALLACSLPARRATRIDPWPVLAE
ncbi:MAG: ABC transporter permease [Acidobacteria bacterium]|nr:ABC transporter permease [Acidobacteriota bacterium]